jgi:class 3 adenylate cyclase
VHRRFLELLPQVTGQSKPSIALNLDVRGFSQFSLTVDSVDAAIYIRKVYERILTDYFPYADFFKSTGDGLLLVFELDERDEENLKKTANRVVTTALDLLDAFPTLLEDDSWIYFEVPKQIGIGVARGAASRLAAGDETLDYSGNALNSASRLMDIARPSGVVIDSSFPFHLLDDELQQPFTEDPNVYVRSIAEKLPTNVFYTADLTTIPTANRKPLDKVEWKEINQEFTLAKMKQTAYFLFDLEAEPIDPSKIFVTLDHPAVTPSGGRSKGILTEVKPRADEVFYSVDAGRPRLTIQYSALVERLETKGVKRSWPLKLLIRYPT